MGQQKPVRQSLSIFSFWAGKNLAPSTCRAAMRLPVDLTAYELQWLAQALVVLWEGSDWVFDQDELRLLRELQDRLDALNKRRSPRARPASPLHLDSASIGR